MNKLCLKKNLLISDTYQSTLSIIAGQNIGFTN